MIITVVDHHSGWANKFNKESQLLRNLLGDALVNVHHIGSTAVPGLKAKPIIDIMLEVRELSLLDEQRVLFEKMGYEVMGEMGISGRRYFRKGGDRRTHQIHAFQSGDTNLVRHLAFRDYLMVNKKVAEEYGILKFNIAQRCNNDIERYSEEKNDFVKYHEKKALEWYAQQ
ncbi:MAG: GrpB family protein [Bacteroidota bacterium]